MAGTGVFPSTKKSEANSIIVSKSGVAECRVNLPVTGSTKANLFPSQVTKQRLKNEHILPRLRLQCTQSAFSRITGQIPGPVKTRVESQYSSQGGLGPTHSQIQANENNRSAWGDMYFWALLVMSPHLLPSFVELRYSQAPVTANSGMQHHSFLFQWTDDAITNFQHRSRATQNQHQRLVSKIRRPLLWGT